MERTIRIMDLITMTGILAAIGGIFLCLFLLFRPFNAGATVPDVVTAGSVGLEISLQWVQPIIGRAIVEDSLIKQRNGTAICEAIMVPDRTDPATCMLNSASPMAQTPVYGEAKETDHAARTQWVMGRLIVELTRHSMHVGTGIGNPFAERENRRIMTIAKEAGKKLDDDVKTVSPGR